MKYDELISHSNGDFDSWRLEHRLSNRRGAMIDAVNRGDNTIAVTTRNVARFTLWLHPRMVDVSKPVVVRVDGKQRFDGRVRPSLGHGAGILRAEAGLGTDLSDQDRVDRGQLRSQCHVHHGVTENTEVGFGKPRINTDERG